MSLSRSATQTTKSVLDFEEILKVELKNDIVQSFNTRWDGIVIAMEKQPDEETLENYFSTFKDTQKS